MLTQQLQRLSARRLWMLKAGQCKANFLLIGN
jgi:hypothetical protein